MKNYWTLSKNLVKAYTDYNKETIDQIEKDIVVRYDYVEKRIEKLKEELEDLERENKGAEIQVNTIKNRMEV